MTEPNALSSICSAVYPNQPSRILKKMTLDIVKIQLTLLNALQILDRPKDFDDLYLKKHLRQG